MTKQLSEMAERVSVSARRTDKTLRRIVRRDWGEQQDVSGETGLEVVQSIAQVDARQAKMMQSPLEGFGTSVTVEGKSLCGSECVPFYAG